VIAGKGERPIRVGGGEGGEKGDAHTRSFVDRDVEKKVAWKKKAGYQDCMFLLAAASYFLHNKREVSQKERGEYRRGHLLRLGQSRCQSLR